MITAIQEDKKTQTRRVIKELKEPDKWHGILWKAMGLPNVTGAFVFDNREGKKVNIKPRYHVGQVLYVKEAWCIDKMFDHLKPIQIPDHDNVRRYFRNDPLLRYGYGGRWRSPLFMPAWAARYFLRITDVRAERLQSITEEDAIAEGVNFNTYGIKRGYGLDADKWATAARDAYAELWDSINKKMTWSMNLWVWVYKLELVKK